MTESHDDLRGGERVITPPPATDAGLLFIGRIHTPWSERGQCPRHGDLAGPTCRIVIDDIWREALRGVDQHSQLEVFYWLHHSRRDLVWQSPKNDGQVRGTFSIRSPVRPNPIGTSIVLIERIEGTTLFVKGLDCLDGTPLIDLKPVRKAPDCEPAVPSTAE